jgi:hypothetical protein
MRFWVDDWDIYFRASSDGGRTWPDPMVRVDTDDTGASATSPVVAATSADEVHVAWSDSRGDVPTWKIYTSTGLRVPSGVESVNLWSEGTHLSVWPNPSVPGQEVRVVLRRAETEPWSVRLYDPSGRCLRTLHTRDATAIWDGKDCEGKELPTGVYWLRVDAAWGRAGRSLIRVR